MKALVIARVAVTRLLRDRSNIFFVFMLPMLLVLVLGAAFGGSFDPRIGILAESEGPLGREIAERVAALDGLEVTEWDDRDALVLAVERGTLEAAVLIPADHDDALARGDRSEIEYVARPDADAMALRNTVEAVVIEQGALLRAAALAVSRTGVNWDDAVATAREQTGEVSSVEVVPRVVGDLNPFERLGQFQLGAYSQLLLFVFLTSLTGSTALIESRRLGVSGRMIATPTAVRTVLAGEALGRLAVALVQGAFIMAGTALLFGVSWGDPLAAVAILFVFSLAASGAAMLMGATFRSVEQAGGIGVVLGLGMAALGGSMLPLMVMEMFSPTLFRIAHVTPHAWGIRAFETIILGDGTLVDIVPELGVLAAFAAVTYALGTWRLRVALTRP